MKFIKSKIFIITSIVIVSLVGLFLGFYFILKSSLKLNGSDLINIGYNEQYQELGATLKIFNMS